MRQVIESRNRSGANVLTPPVREPWWRQFLSKFDDPVIRILMIAAVLAIVAGVSEGKYTEGVGIILAILLATTLAFVNEFKANKEFDILNKVNDDVPVKTVRGGRYLAVPRRDLVVGDIALIEIGEEIPCDGTVLQSMSFQVEESSLTGESKPVVKFCEGASSGQGEEETAYPRHLSAPGPPRCRWPCRDAGHGSGRFHRNRQDGAFRRRRNRGRNPPECPASRG